MDYSELLAAIEAYSKRPDLSGLVASTFLPLAISRLGRNLKVEENLVSQAALNIATNPHTFTETIGAVSLIRWNGSNPKHKLRSGTQQELDNLASLAPGGTPTLYRIRGKQLEIAPFQAGEYKVELYTEPAISATTTDHPVADRYPQLYIYGAMIELHHYEKNWNDRAAAVEVFAAEVRECNRQRSMQQTDKPSMGLG